MCALFVVAAVGVILLLMALVVFSKKRLSEVYDFFVFNKNSAFLTLGIGGCWFLLNVLHLSLADFGEYKHILFLIFFSVLLMSFIWLRELLAVRGIAVLCLVLSDAVLWCIYTEHMVGKVVFVSFVYVMISLSMLIGALPYLWRDSVSYIIQHSCARYVMSCILFAVGLWFVAMPLVNICFGGCS